MSHGAYIFNEKIQETWILRSVELPVEVLLAALKICIHVYPTVRDIDSDDVTILDKTERTHKSSLWRYITDRTT
jgi:hypothetical protein